MADLHSESLDRLFRAVLSLRDTDECYRFFEDICTVKELSSIAQRLDAARALHRGMVYSEVEKESGASSATISRVNRCLQYGSGGYALVLEREKDE
ncbi:MAG: hypothetical protein K5855_04650 [Oscillospiraceae bacterium]|jgi:TrpR-related protein YerC/YecD|nr:hypothetical protein [Oscillospiraceae bacterium]